MGQMNKRMKELQEKSRLPLHEIREIIASEKGTQALTSAIRHAQHAALEAVTTATKGAVVWRDEAAKHFGLPETIIDRPRRRLKAMEGLREELVRATEDVQSRVTQIY